jgi:hypothetical protein
VTRKTLRTVSASRKKASPKKASPKKPWHGRYPAIEWTKEILDLLGKVPDREISERYGIAVSTLNKKRHRSGIPPFKRTIRRTAKVVKILGFPTKEAARLLDLSRHQVKALRKEWGLPPPSPTEWLWDRKTLARLGREPDTWIAWDTGMGFRTVRAKREALGIAPCGLLRRWTPQEKALLGTAPDDVIAKRISRTPGAVLAYRLKLKIPAWKATSKVRPRSGG